MSWICPICSSENTDFIMEGIKKTECLCGYKQPSDASFQTEPITKIKRDRISHFPLAIFLIVIFEPIGRNIYGHIRNYINATVSIATDSEALMWARIIAILAGSFSVGFGIIGWFTGKRFVSAVNDTHYSRKRKLFTIWGIALFFVLFYFI